MKGARLLLNEVKEKQVGVHDEEMRIDIDFSEETLKSFIFTYCQDLFVFGGKNVRALTDYWLLAIESEPIRAK